MRDLVVYCIGYASQLSAYVFLLTDRYPYSGPNAFVSARDDETPLTAKGMMFAALAYFVLPTDAIPDFIAGIGYTDDAAVLLATLNLVGRHLKPRHRAAARADVEKLRTPG